jgi:acyl-CoA reductase-like NAD-dependent aldehyde dehydrogenase
MYLCDKFFFGNNWAKSSSNNFFYTFSPINNNKISKYKNPKIEDCEKAVKSAVNGFVNWKDKSKLYKSYLLKKVYFEINKNAQKLAFYESLETGKPHDQALKEVLASSRYWLSAANILKKFNNQNFFFKNNTASLIYQPIGPVSLILPWNFPFVVMSERLPFILAAGCSVVIKPSEYASLSLFMFMKIIKKVNFPKGTINLLTGNGNFVGKYLVKNKEIAMVSFTGSEKVGKSISVECAKNFKKISLELGGKNNFIIDRNVNYNEVVKNFIKTFTYNAGQNCVAPSRLFVHYRDYRKVCDLLYSQLKNTNSHLYGPISNKTHFLKIKKLIKQLIKKKIFPSYGSLNINAENNYFFDPLVFEDKNNKINILKNELFSPIVQIISYRNENKLLELLDVGNYGLAAYIWSSKKKFIKFLIKKLVVGRIWVNSLMINYPNLPIGGLKNSGIGKECGLEGIKNYTIFKTIIRAK